MKIEDFCFPVSMVETYHHTDSGLKLNNFLTVMDGRDNKAISVVKPSYKLIGNEELIDKCLSTLQATDIRYELDTYHSFCSPNRMKMKLNLPDYQVKDDQGENINLSLHIHNSYDMSEGARLLFGGIRLICTNGMVLGKVLGSWYSKHTSGFNINKLQRYMDEAYKKIPEINQRIEALQNMEGREVCNDLLKNVEKGLGKTIKQAADYELAKEGEYNAWLLYNILTYYISHTIARSQRARYEAGVSKIFNL